MLGIHSMSRMLALVSILVVAGCTSSRPSGVVKQFYRAVEAGEVEAASKLVSGSLASSMGPDKLKALLTQETKKISRKEGIASLEILSEEVKGKVADVRVKVTYGNGETEEQDVTLTMIDGRWTLSPKNK